MLDFNGENRYSYYNDMKVGVLCLFLVMHELVLFNKLTKGKPRHSSPSNPVLLSHKGVRNPFRELRNRKGGERKRGVP